MTLPELRRTSPTGRGLLFLVALKLGVMTAAPALAQSSFPALDPAMVPGAETRTENAVPVAEPLPAPPAVDTTDSNQPPVDFQADQVSYDDPTQVVTATGHIEMKQDGRTLTADKVTYDMPRDLVTAEGDVTLVDEQGNVHKANHVELTQQMRSGVITGMISRLNDGSRFTAREGHRIAGVKTEMKDASYTPCKVCETNPKPLWQIKADRVTHDEKTKMVTYKNARMEFAGVPFFYSPYFMHADPTVKRKSGLLRPKYGWSSETGTYVEGGYYFGDIAPNMDASLRVRPTMERGVLTQGEWRQRFERGELTLDGGYVKSDRKEEDGRIEQDRDRGHLFAKGSYDLTDTWRMGLDAKAVSDKSYLRLYDITGEDILQNTVYAERLSGRDYTNISARSFRDLRLGVRPEQPEVLPEFTHRMYGRPQGLLGGRWEAGLSSIYLHRPTSGEQDVQRGSMDLGWERRLVADMGLVTTVNGSARVDAYNVIDNQNIPGADNNSRETRTHGVASFVSTYPLKKRFESVSWLVEPMFGGAISPSHNEKDDDIPNEDSQDIILDTSNLFSDNRFPGVDRQEDGARVTYGMKTGLYGDQGHYGSVFVGQSYRFDDAAYFEQGTGLENKNSSYVGQINLGLDDKLQADYRFQLDSESLAPERHEFAGSSVWGPMTTTLRYIYVNGIQGTEFLETRQQAELGAEYRFNPIWRAYGTALEDLGEEPGLRRARLGLGYIDECFSFALEAARNLTDDASGESETVVTARIGFKNIGEISGPDIALREDNTDKK